MNLGSDFLSSAKNLAMKKYLLLLLTCLTLPLDCYQYQLSVCSVFQNEAYYLREWIEFHKRVGVEHFWLYNNNSTDNYLEELLPYIEKGLVELIEWSTPDVFGQQAYNVAQCAAFNDALAQARNKSKWLAAIDIDEFIIPVSGKSLPKVLNSKFQTAAAIYINWMMYGTSGIEKCPKDELTKHLLYRAKTTSPLNGMGKSIVRTRYAAHYGNPHICSLINGKYFNGNGNVSQSKGGVFIKYLRINHYWCKDLDFMNNIKIPRIMKWGSSADHVRKDEATMNEVYDPIILNY